MFPLLGFLLLAKMPNCFASYYTTRTEIFCVFLSLVIPSSLEFIDHLNILIIVVLVP